MSEKYKHTATSLRDQQGCRLQHRPKLSSTRAESLQREAKPNFQAVHPSNTYSHLTYPPYKGSKEKSSPQCLIKIVIVKQPSRRARTNCVRSSRKRKAPSCLLGTTLATRVQDQTCWKRLMAAKVIRASLRAMPSKSENVQRRT